MWEKNNGDENYALQNQFTAYLVTAVKNQRISYLRRLSRWNKYEVSTELWDNLLDITDEADFLLDLAVMQQLENERLHDAIMHLQQRERYIFLAKALDDRTLAQLADELGMNYGAVAMAYHRAVRRIRKAMGGEQE